MSGMAERHSGDNMLVWLRAAQSGCQDSMGKLLQALRPYLLLIANEEMDADLRSKGGASDLVQETYLEAQRDFPRFSGASEEQLMAWLRRILQRNLSNFARSYRDTDKRDLARETAPILNGNGKTLGHSLVSEIPSPRGQAIAAEQAIQLEHALASLPDESRQVILWRQIDRLSFKEIGEMLGKSDEAARKIWFRSLERLRQYLEPFHES